MYKFGYIMRKRREKE